MINRSANNSQEDLEQKIQIIKSRYFSDEIFKSFDTATQRHKVSTCRGMTDREMAKSNIS